MLHPSSKATVENEVVREDAVEMLRSPRSICCAPVWIGWVSALDSDEAGSCSLLGDVASFLGRRGWWTLKGSGIRG